MGMIRGNSSYMTDKFSIVQNFGLCQGDIADIHLGMFAGVPVVAKKARATADNDLLANEERSLKDLMPKMLADAKAKEWSFCIPQFIGTFKDPKANAIEFFPGFFSVEDIRKISKGVDARTLVWQFKRLLGILSWVHHFGYVHGAVLPPHVMYFPDGSIDDERKHSVRLIDWCYSVEYKKTRRLPAWVPDFKSFYAPEVFTKAAVTPATDLYMAVKTMQYLAGGDVTTNKFPSKIPAQISRTMIKCLEKNQFKRPQSVGEVFEEFKAVATDVYGRPKFREFILNI